MISQEGVLFIEPSAQISSEPVVDHLTRKMTAAFRLAEDVARFRGFHVCKCGVFSDNAEWRLPSGEETNSLAVHYLAYHRAEVPEEQLAKVEALTYGEAEPTEEELSRPGPRKHW